MNEPNSRKYGSTPVPHGSVDTRGDGIGPVFKPPDHATPEFGHNARVIYVNGINTNFNQAEDEAKMYARLTGNNVELIHNETLGVGWDAAVTAGETFSPKFAHADKSEKALAAEVLELATAGKDVHIGAYSRGALVTENALGMVSDELQRRGFSKEYVKDRVFSHVTVETFNGASHNMPDGVRAVHYVNKDDILVGQSIGMGGLTPEIRAAASLLLNQDGMGTGSQYEAREHVGNHPNGPVIETPGAPFDQNLAKTVLDQHLVQNVMPDRQKFEAAYRNFEIAGTPRPAPENTPRPEQSTGLQVARGDGPPRPAAPGFQISGAVNEVAGDRVVLDGRGGHYVFSRAELERDAPDRNALDAALKEGNTLRVSLGRDGRPEIAERAPDGNWKAVDAPQPPHASPSVPRPAGVDR